MKPGKKPFFIIIAVLGVCLALLFQNCGTSEYGLYGSRSPQPFQCLDDLVCEQNADNLWLESSSSFPIFRGQFQDVTGDCNSGGFPGNIIAAKTYRVIGTTTTQVGQATTTICDDLGRYRVRVNLGRVPLTTEKYYVALSLDGLDGQGNQVRNLSYPNRSNVEVHFRFLD
jgi:hypothetical protein